MEHKQATFRKAAGGGEFEAVIATLGVVDSDGDTILPGALAGQTVSILPAHDNRSVPLGKARIEERGNEAVAVGRFSLQSDASRAWHSHLRFDLANPPPVQEWSFGFHIDDAEPGQRGRVLRKLHAFEVSPVVAGAGVGTRTLSVKQGQRRSRAVASACDLAEQFNAITARMDGHWSKCRYRFVFGSPEAEALKGLARVFARRLRVPAPVVKLFEPAGAGPADFAREGPILGLAPRQKTADGRRQIYVKAGPLHEMLGTLAHEVRHAGQYDASIIDIASPEYIEGTAEAFERGVVKSLDLPSWADLRAGEGRPPFRAWWGLSEARPGIHWWLDASGQRYDAAAPLGLWRNADFSTDHPGWERVRRVELPGV